MPANGDTSANADKLSGIEEEGDMYEAFAPHVDTSQITVLTDSPAAGTISYTTYNTFCLHEQILFLIKFCFYHFFSIYFLFFFSLNIKKALLVSNRNFVRFVEKVCNYCKEQ